MGFFSGKKSITQTDFLFSDSDGLNNASPDKDVFGGAGVVHSIHIDNAGALAYLKMYDNADPTPGTAPPQIQLEAVASEETVWIIIDGVSFTNLSMAASDTAGTAGAGAGANPAGTVKIHMVVR